jgi:hypothetical protein
MAAMNRPPLCSLHLAAGRREDCPGEACAFWEDGGAVVEPGCTFERVRFEFAGRPDVARWLLGVRYSLESARDSVTVARARNALNAFLPPGLHD